MEVNINKLWRSVHMLREHVQLTQTSAEDNRVLKEFLQLPEINEKHVEGLFQFLSEKILEENFTEAIAVRFEKYLLLLITSALRCDEEVSEGNFHIYQKKCVALAKLIRLSVDARRYASLYFRNKPLPFNVTESSTHKIKKSKTDGSSISDVSIVKCCYQLLSSDPAYFKDLWDWSKFVDVHLGKPKTQNLNQVYINNIIAILTNMTQSQLKKLNGKIPPDVLLDFHNDQQNKYAIPSTIAIQSPFSGEQSITLKFVSDLVTNVEGVLLPIFNKDNYQFYQTTDGSYDKIVKVDSTKVNLRSIGMGVAAGKAICLSGPVGCGKTTLVEYLARMTGRICPKSMEIAQHKKNDKENKTANESIKVKKGNKKSSGGKRKCDEDILEDMIVNSLDLGPSQSQPLNGFLRIQLGDQTDSKMLLGQYRCTDVPGEFIWLPGVLTQAVMNGYWLLLEDLDSATQDTYTILSSLLENNYLSVPGFRDFVKIEPGFQLFVTVRTNKSSTNSAQKSIFSLLEKYLYTINILPLSRNELCKVVSTNYPRLATVANRIVDVFLTFSSGDHRSADNLRQQETGDKADNTERFVALPFEEVSLASVANSGRLVSTRDLIKLCERSNPMFSVTRAECAYFVFQNAVDVFCSYLPQGKEKTKLIVSIGAKLGIIQSRCEHLADEYKPEVQTDSERIRVGRAELFTKSHNAGQDDVEDAADPPVGKKAKLSDAISDRQKKARATFSFTRMASCILERIAVCVSHAEPVLLVGETGVGKTSSVQYLAERTDHKLVVVNMNNQSDVSDLVGGFKPVDLSYVLTPLRCEFETLLRRSFNEMKNESFFNKLATAYNQGSFNIVIKVMITVLNNVFEKMEKDNVREQHRKLLPRWQELKMKLLKLNSQLAKSINISFAFIPGSLVNCIKNGDWVLLDEINLASAETLECLSTILEPDGSVVLLEKGDFTPVKRHPDFRIFACMNPNTDIGKKDLPVGIRNRFTEFFADELTTDADLTLLISDYLSNTGIQKKSVSSLVKLYKKLKLLSRLELNDGLGNRPVYSLRTLCRSLRICAKNLCGSIERNLYESFCMSFLTQLDPASHNIVLQLIKDSLLSNAKAILKQSIPKPGEDYLNFEGYWIQQGPKTLQECSNYILTTSVRENLKDLSRIVSIGKLPVLLQGPTSAGKTSLIEYVAKRSGNHCLRINNHEHTDLQEYIGTYAADVTGKLSFKEGVLVQAMRNGYWIILDELNLASTDILEALNRVLDDNRELYIPETQTVVKAHPNFMLFATQNPPGLYGGRKTLSRAFKNRFIELHFSDIPRHELEIILEQRCLIPASYARKMVMSMADLQKNRKTTTAKNIFTLRDLFRWGNRYTYADKRLLDDKSYDWNQHLVEEGFLVLSAKVRTAIEIDIIEETLYKNFRKRINLERLFDARSDAESSPVTRDIITSIRGFKHRSDIVWTRNMTRMAVLTAKALQFNEPVLLVGPTGCGKTTVCQILAAVRSVQLRILNCHMHTEGADFLGGLRPCRQQSDGNDGNKLFEWADGPLIYAMQEGSYFMADEISLAEDSVLERLNCVLEPERTVLLAEKGGVAEGDLQAEGISSDFIVQAREGFQFLATMNPGGDFGKKELSPALRNRFTEIWCLPSDSKEDLVQIASNCLTDQSLTSREPLRAVAEFIVEVVLYMRDSVEKFKFSIRDILAWANYIVTNDHLSFPEKALYGLETIFLDSLEMLPHESAEKVEALKMQITEYAIRQASEILKENVSIAELQSKRGQEVVLADDRFGIHPFFIPVNPTASGIPSCNKNFLFDAPTTKKNLFRLLSALTLKKPILLEGPPGVGKTSSVENIAHAIGFNIVRINLCEHTDLADLFGTDLPAEDNLLERGIEEQAPSQGLASIGSFVWRDGPLLAALKAENTWILLDEMNLAPQSVLEGLNAILDHRGEVFIPELNKSFVLNKRTRIFACQNPLKQGGGRKGLPQSFLNRFNKVYLRKLSTDDLLYVVNGKYAEYFEKLRHGFEEMLKSESTTGRQGNLFDLFKNLQVKTEDVAETVDAPLAFDLSDRLVKFSEILDRGIADMEFGLKGGPFEINLRDILRWCDLLESPDTGFVIRAGVTFERSFSDFLLILYERMKLVYHQRMRSDLDRAFIRQAFARVFNCDADQLNAQSEDVGLFWSEDKIFLNDIVLKREPSADALASVTQFRGKEQSPLLLGSQREMLKNIVECVLMEKPVLLSGPSDTGKTKLIHVLGALSHQESNTDTIDDSVTGSFQQIDLNRHLEEIVERVAGVLTHVMQSAVVNDDSLDIVTDLLHLWSEYNRLTKSQPEANKTANVMSEELRLFRQRILRLQKVMDRLLDCPSLTLLPDSHRVVLEQQQRLLTTLQRHVSTAESLNTGGSFEWVDSKIVKSLKLGQYILLEHVNLCSSAVLDRLNPVFEPNGSLMISEKGVSAGMDGGGAEIVEKSPNFRAFLTIDPKNGELSRAMRNRCIELSLSRDSFSVDDLRAIVHGQGIVDIEAINSLLRTHERIARLTEINAYSVTHLTQFAFLVASYKRIGYDLDRAIYVSGMEVYVYSASVDLMGYGLAFYQNKLREIVMDESKRFAEDINNRPAISSEEDHLENLTLRCGDLSDISLIKLQAEPLNILLKYPGRAPEHLASCLGQFETLNMADVPEERLMRFLVYSLYESSSMNDVRLRCCYFQRLLQSNPQLQQLSTSLSDCVLKFASQFGREKSLCLPWNRRLYPRIRDYVSPAGDDHKDLALSSQLLLNLLLDDVPHKTYRKLADCDALTYSQAIAERKVNDKLGNIFVQNLAVFLAQLHVTLNTTFNHARPDLDSYTRLITAYLWVNRLLTQSQEKLFTHNSPNTEMIDKLLLHFKWLRKHLLGPLEQLLPSYSHVVDGAFVQSLQAMDDYVLNAKPPLDLMRKTFSKEMTQFQPFHRQDQIDLFDLAQRMEQLLRLAPSYGSFTAELVVRKFVALQGSKKALAIVRGNPLITLGYKIKASDGQREDNDAMPQTLREAVEELMRYLRTEDDDSAERAFENLDELKAEIDEMEKFINAEEEDVPEYAKPKGLELAMMSLREYYLNKGLVHVVSNGGGGGAAPEINTAYCEDIPSLSPATWQLIQLLGSSKYRNFSKVWSKMLRYFVDLEDSREFSRLLHSLGSTTYKHFVTFHHLIAAAQQQQQLNNLSIHADCSRVLKSPSEIDCRYVYAGPALVNAFTELLFQTDGNLKPIPLSELDLWKRSLQQLRQLLWHNAATMTPANNVALNNFVESQVNARRLLLEIEYVRGLCASMENENASDYNEGFLQLTDGLDSAYTRARDVPLTTYDHESLRYLTAQYHGSLVGVMTGAVELCLLTFTPLIDPVEKRRLKREYLLEDINCLTAMTTAYDFMKITMNYKRYGVEIYEALEGRLRELKERQKKFSQKVALRPETGLYGGLVQHITHFLKTNCDPQSLNKLLHAVQRTWADLTRDFKPSNVAQILDSSAETLSKLDLWIANSQRFVNHILKPYTAYYQDFLQPLQSSIGRLRFGCEGLKVALSQLRSSYEHHHVNINAQGKLHRVLAHIVEFPSAATLDVFNVHGSRDILKNRSAIFSVLDTVPGSEHDYFRLLKAKITDLRNVSVIANCMTDETFRELYFALNVSNQIWQEEEERRRRQRADEESLYVQKTRCEEEDEEWLEMQEIEAVFPTSVREDFGEFIVEDSLEKVMKLDKKKDLKAKVPEVIRNEDYGFLVENFMLIIEQYTRASYYHEQQQQRSSLSASPTKDQSRHRLEFIEPFRQRMQTFVKLYTHYKASLNDIIDEASYNSFAFAVGLQQQLLDELSFPQRVTRPYNFYKNSNIPEIISCTELLDRIELRAKEQLALYPEHASLVDIVRVIARIRRLPSVSPVARFNSGFQILRQKIAQWNEVAHRQNNLQHEEFEVAAYVQKWTKLELQFWRTCLNETYAKVESQAYKYWFFMYNLVQEFMGDRAVDRSLTEIADAEKRFAEGEARLEEASDKDKSKVTVRDVTRIMSRFMEASCYGDFHVRLQLLRSFELFIQNLREYSEEDVEHEQQSPPPQNGNDVDKRCQLIAGLHNLQIYFSQFSAEIDEAKKSMRSPIEKKLKEFVKIESYNKDLSYFSMRSNVARVHRNLNKFLKEYEQALQQKITPVFQPKDATVRDYSFEQDKGKGKNLRFEAKIKYYLGDTKLYVAPLRLKEDCNSAINGIDEESSGGEGQVGTQLLQRVQHLFITARSVVKETVSNAAYPQLIIALDVLLSDHLERCNHLRSLTVDRSKERRKQIIEAKQILQQKRKGLTDLFKSLAQLGVSYKTGLMELSLRSEFEDYALPPFSIRSLLLALPSGVGQRGLVSVLPLSEHLGRYYAKSVFKLRLLQNIMLSPLAELGPPIIERIKGFAVDFFLMVQHQRNLLATTTNNIYDFLTALRDVKDVASIVSASSSASTSTSHLDFVQNREIYMALQRSLRRVRYVFEQFKILLTCPPNRQGDEDHVFAGCDSLFVQNSPAFESLTKNCDAILLLARQTLADMERNDSDFLSWEKVASYEASHKSLVSLIEQVRKSFAAGEGGDGQYLPIAKPLNGLLSFMAEQMDIRADAMAMPKDSDGNFSTELENILHLVLLAMQKLYKKHPKPSETDTDIASGTVAASGPGQEKSPTRAKNGNAEDSADPETEIQDHHLKKKLIDNLTDDWDLMAMASITTKLRNVLLSLKHSSEAEGKMLWGRQLAAAVPLLEQYSLLAQFILSQQMGAHKVAVKMLSIMLTAFVEISSKGFCVPSDLLHEEEGQGKQDQKQGEGFGLEDGEGENDASDKIESEDQLDDAKRPEDRKDEGDKEQPDCKEEKGIEMSDDFDGKMQDIEKPEGEEDDSGESEDEEDLSKEMGETEEGAEKLDDQIWGDDEEPEEQEEDEENDMQEEDDGKGSKDEKDSHNDLDTKNDAAKNDGGPDEPDKDGLDATDEPSSKDEKRKEKEKDIDQMKDPEMDDDQVNPYHNELEEPPEAEEMDLGDMMNGNEEDRGDDDEHGDDENPFDIDKMKENMQAPEESAEDGNEDEEEKKDEEKDGEKGDSDDSDSDQENDEGKDEMKKDPEANEDDKGDEENLDEPETQKRGELPTEEEAEKENEEKEQEPRAEQPEEYDQSKDKTSKEENVQSMPDTEQKGSADQVQNEEAQKDIKQEQKMDEQETGEEKDGVGQAENEENDGGHQGIADTQETISREDRKNERQTQEKRKQGRTDEERTLGEAEKNKLKQLKTIDKLKEQNDDKDTKDDADKDEPEAEAEEYQHVKDPKSSDKTTLDNATEEQTKQIQHQDDEDEDEEKKADDAEGETNDELMDVDAEAEPPQNEENLEEMSAEKMENKSEKSSKSDKTKERAEAQEEMEIEGEVVQTMTVQRSDDTTAHCSKEILMDIASHAEELSAAETLELRKMYQQQLVASRGTLPEHEHYETWQQVSLRMSQNARELCEQLRLILEPTKCTRLKGDYRTGRRINMKKIIPYIASQFRKDKIWLRRTKPAQRDYKITIAIDDSKSMHHNNSKTLTLEAISLVSQALTLLESGRLSVVSFGEKPQIILNHTEQFDGPKLVNALDFAQDKTKIAELLDFVRTINTEEGSMGADNGLFENLLLILSDGRNIFSEGRTKVKNAIKLARLQRMFLVYIIIDNPENKNSILDIQTMEMLPDRSVSIKSYLDDFPFPYYVIVRDLNQLPLVLSEAMRQWFELVNSEQ